MRRFLLFWFVTLWIGLFGAFGCDSLAFSSDKSLPRIGAESLLVQFVRNLDGDVKVASFVQTKTFTKYNRSFVTTGNVRFVKDRGLLWRQDTPKPLSFVASKNGYCVGGVATQFSKLPYVDRIKSMVDDVLAGNYDKLYEAFDVEYVENGGDSWLLVLVPTYSKMSQVMKKISFRGSKTDLLDFSVNYVNDVVLSVIFDKTDDDGGDYAFEC